MALQRSLAGAVSQGAIPDTVVMLEHPPVVTLGRRAEPGELHVPDGAEVDVVETNRGGKSTYHAPGQLVCYPIVDLRRHGQDVKRYVRLARRRAHPQPSRRSASRAVRLEGDNMTGVWLERAAAQARLDRRPRLEVGDDARLRAQRRPRSGAVHGVDHRLRARRRRVHDDGARARPAGHGRRGRPARRRRTRRGASGSRSSRSPPRTAPGSGRSPCTSGSPPRRNDSVPISGARRRPPYRRRRCPVTPTCSSLSPPRSWSRRSSLRPKGERLSAARASWTLTPGVAQPGRHPGHDRRDDLQARLDEDGPAADRLHERAEAEADGRLRPHRQPVRLPGGPSRSRSSSAATRPTRATSGRSRTRAQATSTARRTA